jgi:hypothetical protein
MTHTQVIQGLRDGSIDPKSLPISYIQRDGYQLVDNNRSTSVLTEAGIPESKWNLQPADQRTTQAIQQKLTSNNLPSTGTTQVKVTKGSN